MADNKFTATDYANAAAGAYSLISGLTARRPKPIKAVKYKANIRPASGDEIALGRAKQQIAQQTAAATQDVNRIAGADVNKGLAARLTVQKQAQDAVVNAEAQNSALLRQDQIRQADAESQQDLVNTQSENRANEVNFGADQQAYLGRVDAARSGVSSSLNYMAQREANRANNAILEKQAQQQIQVIKNSAYQQAYQNARIAGATDDEARAAAMAAAAKYEVNQKIYGN